jgi:hypothetical protein
MDFHQLKDTNERRRSFHMTRAIFLVQYRVALEILPILEQNAAVGKILDQGDTRLGLDKGLYAHFKYQYLDVIKAGRYAALEAVALTYAPAPDAKIEQWAALDSRVTMKAGQRPWPVDDL